MPNKAELTKLVALLRKLGVNSASFDSEGRIVSLQLTANAPSKRTRRSRKQYPQEYPEMPITAGAPIPKAALPQPPDRIQTDMPDDADMLFWSTFQVEDSSN